MINILRKKLICTVVIISFIIIATIIAFLIISSKANISKYDLNEDSVIFDIKTSEEPYVKLLISKENKTENIKLEEYVRGVISAEMPAEFDIEALKAQAVAARTYAVAHMGAYSGRQYDKQSNIDLIDTVECQVYINKNDRLNSWAENKREEYWKKINDAVNLTHGEVITYNGVIVSEPFFFSCSSGETENSEDVFSNPEPYLRSVSSIEDKGAPEYESTVKISNENFIKKINSKYSGSNLKSNNIKNQVTVISRSESGSIKEIKVGSITMKGLQFRSILGLNSENINIKYYNNYIEFNCKGYGHGVGMSQWGANFMGKSGKNYIYILQHYYKGVSIEKLKYK